MAFGAYNSFGQGLREVLLSRRYTILEHTEQTKGGPSPKENIKNTEGRTATESNLLLRRSFRGSVHSKVLRDSKKILNKEPSQKPFCYHKREASFSLKVPSSGHCDAENLQAHLEPPAIPPIGSIQAADPTGVIGEQRDLESMQRRTNEKSHLKRAHGGSNSTSSSYGSIIG